MQVILLFIFIYFTKLHFLSVPAFDSAEQLNLRCFYRFVDFKTESPKPTRKFKFCYRAWNYMWLYEENNEIHDLVLMEILYYSLIKFWGKFRTSNLASNHHNQIYAVPTIFQAVIGGFIGTRCLTKMKSSSFLLM